MLRIVEARAHFVPRFSASFSFRYRNARAFHDAPRGGREEESRVHAAHTSRNLFPQFSHTDFTKRTRSSVYIYTYTRSYILLCLSFPLRNKFARDRTYLSRVLTCVFPDLHFDKRRAIKGQRGKFCKREQRAMSISRSISKLS